MKNTHHKQTINSLKLQNRIFWTLIFFGLVGLTLYLTRSRIISPCQKNGCYIEVRMITEDKTELEQITDYIVKKFEKYGRQTAVKALACFISESGLRPDAYNYNTNGSSDFNVPQINSIHTKVYGSDFQHDWKTAIDVAEKIYLSHNKTFSAWYGKACR